MSLTLLRQPFSRPLTFVFFNTIQYWIVSRQYSGAAPTRHSQALVYMPILRKLPYLPQGLAPNMAMIVWGKPEKPKYIMTWRGMRVCVYVYMCVCVYVYVCMHVCLYVCMWMYIYVCMCTYTYYNNRAL